MAAALNSPATQISRMPAMKNSAPQTSAISIVCPKSGCSTSSVITSRSNPMATLFAGISGLRVDSANSQATRITKAGLTNSDGWMLTPRSTIQRRAPFTSAPKCSVAASSSTETTKTKSESRRTWRGDRYDMPSRIAIAGTR
jgi:hypothetical protein